MNAYYPEHVLVAVLHEAARLQDNILLADDERLGGILNDAAARAPELFGRFTWHPVYRHSSYLSEALHRLDMGEAIVRRNAEVVRFVPSGRTKGSYGQDVMKRFNPDEQTEIAKVAEEVVHAFRD